MPKRNKQVQVMDLPKVLYMVAGVGFEPAILWAQGTELPTEPPHPTITILVASREVKLKFNEEFRCRGRRKQAGIDP